MTPRQKVSMFSALIAAPILIAGAWFTSHLIEAYHVQEFLTNFEKINYSKPPLTTDQVEALMGPPLRIEHAESTGIIGDVYHYSVQATSHDPVQDFKVIFINGVVFHTQLPAPANS